MTPTKVAFARLYDRKNALVAAHMLNDRVLPFFEEQDVSLLRILTDRGTEYCGQREHHEYQLYLAVVKHLPLANEDQVSADEWGLRTFPQNHPG